MTVPRTPPEHATRSAPTSRHRCNATHLEALRALLEGYRIEVVSHPPGADLPGTYWGEPEAGIVRQVLHVRPDTPVHSALHEACHLICMDPDRRARVHTDAGGDDPEECAVCRLQVLLADLLPGIGRDALMDDMDAWGYSFRLGSAAAWFHQDSEDADLWLRTQGLIDADGKPLFRLRGTPLTGPDDRVTGSAFPH